MIITKLCDPKIKASCERLLTKSQTQIQIIGIVIQDFSLAY